MNNIIANLYQLNDAELQVLFESIRGYLNNSVYVYSTPDLSYEDYQEGCDYLVEVKKEMQERNDARYKYAY